MAKFRIRNQEDPAPQAFERPTDIPGAPRVDAPGRFRIRETDRIRRSQQLEADVRRQRTESALELQTQQAFGADAQLARTETGGFAEFTAGSPTIEDPFPVERLALARADLARSQTFEGEIAKIKDKFPQFEINELVDPFGGRLIAVRPPGTSDVTLLDSGDVTTFNDWMDVAGTVATPEFATETMAALRTRGLSLTKRVFGVGLAGLAGRSADLAIENARGFERLALSDMAADAALTGAIAGTAELLFAPLRMIGRGVKKGGALPFSDTDRRANQILRDAGVEEGLPLGAVQPLIGGMERMAGRTSGQVREQRLREGQAVLSEIRDRREQLAPVGLTGLRDEELETVIDQAERDLAATLGILAPNPALARRAARNAGDHLEEVTRISRDRKYAHAATLDPNGEVSFDLTPALQARNEILNPIQSRLNPEIVEAEVQAVNQRRRIDAALRGEKFTPLTADEIAELGFVNIALEPSAALKAALDDVAKLDPNIRMAGDTSAFEQLKELRRRFWNLMQSPDGQLPTNDNRLAAQMWGVLTNIMNSPNGGSPEFVAAYRAAAASHARRDLMLGNVQVQNLLQSETLDPSDILFEIVRPYNSTYMRAMQRLAPDEWQVIQEAFYADLMAKPDKIRRTLDTFRGDPRALRAVMTAEQEAAALAWYRTWQNFQIGPGKQAVETVQRGTGRHRLIVDKGNPTAIDEFYQQVGGKETAQGRAVRGAALEKLVEASRLDPEKGVSGVDFQAMNKIITDWEESGQLHALFTPDEIEMLQDRRLVASYLQALFGSDVGVSLQVANMASNLLAVPRGLIEASTGQGVSTLGNALSSVGQAVSNFLVARILMKPGVRQFLIGTEGRPPDMTMGRIMAQVMADTLEDIQTDATDLNEVLRGEGASILSLMENTVQ